MSAAAMNTADCPVCKTFHAEMTPIGPLNTELNVNCRVCGRYILWQQTVELIKEETKDQKKRALLSHLVRRAQNPKEPPHVNDSFVEQGLKEHSLPSAMEQAEALILWVGDRSAPGEFVEYDATEIYPVFGAVGPTAVYYLKDNLIKEGVIEETSSNSMLALSFSGWRAYEGLKRGRSDSRKAFMAMQYGRAVLDRLFLAFQAAIRKTGFQLTRLDESPTPGMIDDRLRVDIRTSRFVVVDLTEDNRGAYWEAGFAEGLGKPVFYSCEKGFFEKQGTHFDTNHQFTILWEEKKIAEAAESLKAAIRAALPADAKMTDS